MAGETITIIAFTLHSILFALMLLFVLINPSLLNDSTYVNMMYILLSTLLVHGGYHLGRNNKS